MTKIERYFRELKSLIDREITFENFDRDHVSKLIDQTLKWSQTQTITSRPPRIDARLCYYIACESWVERLLETSLQRHFESTADAEEYVWRRTSQVGWGIPIVGYDTAYIQLIDTFRPKIHKWMEVGSSE